MLESVVVGWIIMVMIVLLCVLLTRNLKVVPEGRRQLAAEFIVTSLYNMFDGIVGEKGRRYIPYLITVLVLLAFSDTIGLFGFKPPTKDLNMTGALAVMSIILVEYAGIRARGFGGWIKHFAEPMPLLAPINIMEIFIRPLSLCMRLFGNILGAFVVMELIKALLPVGLPVIFSLYFDIFDGLIQAYVFVFLTSLFLKEALEH